LAGGPYLRNATGQQPFNTHRGTSEEQNDSPQRRRNISGISDCVFTLIQLWALDIFLAQSIPPPQLRPKPVHGDRTPITGIELLIPTLFLQYRPLTQIPCQPAQYRQPITTQMLWTRDQCLRSHTLRWNAHRPLATYSGLPGTRVGFCGGRRRRRRLREGGGRSWRHCSTPLRYDQRY
jgi:hypothetical protein